MKKHTGVIIITILSLIWSSTWMAIKVGLETLPPFLSAGLRFFIAFVALLLFARQQKIPIPYNLKSHLFFLGFSFINFFGGYALVYWGEQYINSGLASILFSVMPFYVALFSMKLLKTEQITFKKMLGITVGFCGVVLIFKDQLHLSHPMAFWGMAALLISPAFSAVGTILAKKARMSFHAVTLSTFPLLYTALTFFLFHFILEQNAPAIFTLNAVLSLFYLGLFGTALAFVLYFYLLKTTSAVLMSLITFITPPLALFWGWVVLGEAITIQLIIGMIIIFSGIAIVRRS